MSRGKSRNETVAFHYSLLYSDAMDKTMQAFPPGADGAAPCCKPAGRPRASEIEARHQNLIDIAGELFLKLGYGKVSLELIAREAHVAVRTIYVKFGGKAGLFKAVLDNNRKKFFALSDMENDPRPLKEVILDFALHFLDMIATPEAVTLQRMVIAEASSNPELSESFFDAGPRQTRDMLQRFFARADVRAALRDEVDIAILPVFLANSVIGDQFGRFLFGPGTQTPEENLRDLEQRLDLFYRAVLKHP